MGDPPETSLKTLCYTHHGYDFRHRNFLKLSANLEKRLSLIDHFVLQRDKISKTT